MAHLSGKALEYDIANTVIEDSEPERVAEAAREKEARRKRRRQKQVELTKDNGKQRVSEIDPDTLIPRDLVTSLVTVEPFQKEPEDTPPEFKYVNPDKAISTDAWEDLDVVVPPIHLLIRECISDDDDESDPKLSLNHFMFSKPPTSITHSQSISAIPIGGSKATTGDFKRIKPTMAQTLLYPFSVSLSKEQLSKLYKCYVCDRAWTARKTIPTKLSHIKSCAKKHGWSEDTLIQVLKKELDIADLPGSSNLSLPDAVTSLGTPNSLLEVIVDETLPRKLPKKRQHQRNNVLDPTQARSAIVERVNILFGPSDQSNEVPSTQPFRPSKFTSGSNTLFAKVMLEESAIPMIEKSQSDQLGQNVGSNTVHYPHPLSCPSLPCFNASFPSNSQNLDFLTVSGRAIGDLNCRLKNIQLDRTDQVERRLIPVIPHSSPAVIVSPSNKPQQPLTSILQIPKPNSLRDVNDIDDYLRQLIKRNDVLYERILRYEPVHFDMFLNIEGIEELNDRGFRNKLRAFLDKHVSSMGYIFSPSAVTKLTGYRQAITFYTDSALESNRRRR